MERQDVQLNKLTRHKLPLFFLTCKKKAILIQNGAVHLEANEFSKMKSIFIFKLETKED